jgi:hypothetical protein
VRNINALDVESFSAENTFSNAISNISSLCLGMVPSIKSEIQGVHHLVQITFDTIGYTRVESKKPKSRSTFSSRTRSASKSIPEKKTAPYFSSSTSDQQTRLQSLNTHTSYGTSSNSYSIKKVGISKEKSLFLQRVEQRKKERDERMENLRIQRSEKQHEREEARLKREKNYQKYKSNVDYNREQFNSSAKVCNSLRSSSSSLLSNSFYFRE